MNITPPAPQPVAEKKKFRITAVIPTVRYGNIQPEYEVEADTYEEAEKIAMSYIEKIWNKYCEAGSELQSTDNKKVTTSAYKLTELVSHITNVTAYFDPVKHVYVTKDGRQYLSGSAFAHKYQHEFKKDQIVQVLADKHGQPPENIKDLWRLKAEASTSLGTAIHSALEMYGKYLELGRKLGLNKDPIINTALHDHPILKNIVERFFKDRQNEQAFYELFIADEELMWCGQIDRLLIKDLQKKICRVQDFKTNTDVNKNGFNKKLLPPFDYLPDTPLGGYWLQLSFYARIMQRNGWTVEGLDVLHFDGEDWVTYSSEVLDLENV